MKKIISYISIACFTCFIETSGIDVLAGGCNTHMNKNTIIECPEEDFQCLENNDEKYESETTVRS